MATSQAQERLGTLAARFSEASVERGYEYARQERVFNVVFGRTTGLLTGRVDGTHSYRSVAKLQQQDDSWTLLTALCDCPVRQDCKHVVALLFTALDRGLLDSDDVVARRRRGPAPLPGSTSAPAAAASSAPKPQTSAWEKALAPLMPESAAPSSATVPQLALLFEVTEAKPAVSRAGRVYSPAEPAGLRVRPLSMGARGKWIKSEVAWTNINYLSYYRKFSREQTDALSEFLDMARIPGQYPGQTGQWLELTHYNGRHLAQALADLSAKGIVFVQDADPRSPGVRLERDMATLELSIDRRPDGGLDVAPRADLHGRPLDLKHLNFTGEPASLAFHSAPATPGGTADGTLVLTPLAPASAEMIAFARAAEPVHIPAEDEERFLSDYYPRLRQGAPVVAASEEVKLPTIGKPVLSLLANYRKDHRLDLHWEWHYESNGKQISQPLLFDRQDSGYRDEREERRILHEIGKPWELVPSLATEPTLAADGAWTMPGLAPAATLHGMDTVAFTEELLPALRALPDVDVDVNGVVPDYREAVEAPVVQVSTLEKDDRDWFGLEIVVTLEGEQVAFGQIFSAIASGQTRMVLPSGKHFPLDTPELQQLRELIEEARSLSDRPGEELQISRFQVGLWEQFAALGVVKEQAQEWRNSVAGLLNLEDATQDLEAPAGLNADLRPYQLQGFRWLRFLHDHRLGGVLADDMGLGKTLQALALICSLREDGAGSTVHDDGDAGSAGDGASPSVQESSGEGPSEEAASSSTATRPAPFLVVAPSSVVSNWAMEAARFAPGLKTVAVAETFKRSGLDPVQEFAGADLVVTSYALFRLELEHYQNAEWGALVLDEAQFVKNHQSKAYQAVRKLRAPFKLAITGTPLENNLMELWALLSIVAPGLFPSPGKFSEYYRRPIELHGHPKLLGKLRQRIRPLMLRRTKEQVVKELPPKLEQVLTVELNPRHAKAYQTHLQRERQKILGLLEDANKHRFTIFQSLTLLRQMALDPSLVDEELSGVRSSKLDVLFEQLEDVLAEGHRALIFSQFTGFLGKVRERLDADGVQYAYLDGATRKRQDVISSFKEGDAPLFLISLKAGGFGINLTEADYVFLLDPWWNPASEAQAVDRAHRIGQDKQVMVYRLVAKDTIEEKVMALKVKKSKLFDSVAGDEALASTHLTAEDLAGLFRE
ncbi:MULTISPECIES: DEAD/DEAH box helicase [Arthrobacter]|uniref:DEAD/DEAH box helicase n=2 Tax=Arthrobacter TaxID=1663 RepID=A0ABU9KNE4_9MICC|nr:DEAD/DEAH box helicase [Arthrobacter sp. YJM1]MDP5228215.1 DEAD/DEAH box helicase [Arthrobacter sp. YJM1]